MKKLLIVLFGALILGSCAEPECEQYYGEDIANVELKAKKGLTKVDVIPFPYWARMGAGVLTGIPANEEYGVICFYVDPYDIPTDAFEPFYGSGPHNLLNFFDPRATFPGVEFAVEGYAWMEPGNETPHHMHLKGKGAVPIWIITRQQVTDVTLDGIVTIAELDALPEGWPLKGTASIFTEELKPIGGGAPVSSLVLTAKGELEDGRRFDYNLHNKILPGEPIDSNVKLKIFK